MIPRTFWRVWLDEEVPKRYEVFWEGFKDKHPAWELRTIDTTAGLTWMRPQMMEVFLRCTTHAGRSDVVRYEVLYQFGGVYVDTDVECLRPFDALVTDDTKAFAGWEDERLLCPTVMGGPPRHPALDALTAELPQWFASRPLAPPNHATGPYLLTHVWKDRTDVTLLAPQVFYPVHWSEKRKLGGPYPEESVAVHHWDAGWLPNGPPQR